MIYIDKFTNLTIISALLHCHSMLVGDIGKETGYPAQIYEDLEKKYNNKESIDTQDLPKIIKSLEWLLVTRDESTLLDINRNQGLVLIDMLKKGERGEIKNITAHQWFFGIKNKYMLIIQKAIEDLLESDKIHPPYGHDVSFYISGRKEILYISSGVSEGYPLYLYFKTNNLTPDQKIKVKQIQLKHSKEINFKQLGDIRIAAEFELKKEYIEDLIVKIFKEVFEYNDISDLEYTINPI